MRTHFKICTTDKINIHLHNTAMLTEMVVSEEKKKKKKKQISKT